MGIFDNLSGGKSRKDIRAATSAANRQLATSRDASLGYLDTGYGQANNALTQGYDESRDYINTGLTSARGDVNAGYDKSREDLTSGYSRAEQAINDALSRSTAILNPWIQSGHGAQNLYDRALGLQGSDAQAEFYDEYASADPFREYISDQETKRLQAAANAQGALGSGRTDLAVARAGLERGTADLNAYLDRLSTQGARGGQYASQLAGYSDAAGSKVGDYRANLGRDLATGEQNRGNRLADLSYRASDRLADLATGYSTNRAGLATDLAKSKTGVEQGYGSGVAGNYLNQGSQLAGTRNAGLNNLMGIAGTVIAGVNAFNKVPSMRV
jgi:hypothetical protein